MNAEEIIATVRARAATDHAFACAVLGEVLAEIKKTHVDNARWNPRGDRPIWSGQESCVMRIEERLFDLAGVWPEVEAGEEATRS